MAKAIFLFILCFGAAMYFPQTRPTVVELLAPVLNPALTWQTQGEMDQIARELQSLNRQGQPLPKAGKEFNEWMLRNFQGGSGLDAWDNPYTLRIWPDSVGIISNGPDMEIRTEDDLLVTALIQRQRRR